MLSVRPITHRIPDADARAAVTPAASAAVRRAARKMESLMRLRMPPWVE
jgi:hypothetical protein